MWSMGASKIIMYSVNDLSMALFWKNKSKIPFMYNFSAVVSHELKGSALELMLLQDT